MRDQCGWCHPIDGADQWDGFNDSGMEHFTGNPYRHLAREVIQNACDAPAGTDPVRVVFRLLKVHTHEMPGLGEFKTTIQCCSKAATAEGSKAVAFFSVATSVLEAREMSVLQISDYNTNGIPGPSENGKPFFAFMKAKGQSKKDSKTATGSFGIGKYAPYVTSKLRTVFVSTVFKSPENNYVQYTQGKSVLMSHDSSCGTTHQGTGYWGVRERCQPVDETIRCELPEWLLRDGKRDAMPEKLGTTLTVLAFNDEEGWYATLVASVLENFFGAVWSVRLVVEVHVHGELQCTIDRDKIGAMFSAGGLVERIRGQQDDPERLLNCGHYMNTLMQEDSIAESAIIKELGECRIRLRVAEGLPRKVCFLRNGMFISDSLSVPGLKNFSEFKEFVAVVECMDENGCELLRAMEPARHDNFEPEHLPSPGDRSRGKRALKELASWVRERLRHHATNPVTEVSVIDELKEYFGDEAGGAGNGLEELDPQNVVLNPRPRKKNRAYEQAVQGDEDAGGDHEGGGGGNGDDGDGKNTGGERKGKGVDGEGSGGGGTTKVHFPLNNLRVLSQSDQSTKIAFTSGGDGEIFVIVKAAGVDGDTPLKVEDAKYGAHSLPVTSKGEIRIDAKTGVRYSVAIKLAESFRGAVKVSGFKAMNKEG